MSVYSDLNTAWGSQLEQVSVIFQVDYDDNRVEGAMSHLGDRIENREVSRRLTAIALIGANYAASKGYEGGELWSKLFQMMRVKDTDLRRETFSELFRRGLDQYNLARFTHPSWSNIGEMIIHAGITLNSLPKFTSRLIKAFENDRNLSGNQFNEDIRAIPEERVSSSSLDKPTWHFIRQSGEIADDFVDRLINILDDLSNGKEPEEIYGIPPRVVEEFIDVSRDLLDARRNHNPRLTRRIGKPIVRWHEVGTANELRILFPELENIYRTPTQWQVTATDIDSSITTYPSIAGARAAGSYFTVSEPRPIVYLTGNYKANSINQGDSPSWEIPLYEDHSWLMLFNDEGFIQQADGSLQPGVYTLLWPNKVGQQDVKVAFDSDEHQSSSIPEGWTNNLESGWRARKVAFKGADSIKVFVGEKLVKTQFVTGLRKPSFEYGQLQIQDTYSQSGSQVLWALPDIILPPTGARENTWEISVRDSSGKKIYNDKIDASSTSTYMFDRDALQGKSGEFKVSVASKRLGQGIRQSFVIASDLRVKSSPESRYIDRDNSGLDVCEITIEKGNETRKIQLTNTDASYQLDDESICDEVLTIRPRCESIELFNRASGNRSEWFSTGRCHIEDIQNIELTLNYLGSESPELFAVWGPTDSRQLFSPSINGKRKFSLSELQDEVQLKGAFKIYSHSAGQEPLEILNCFNKKLFDSYHFNPESRLLNITFANGNIPKDLRATIFSKNAYWRDPISVNDFTGEVQLPDDLVSLGAVICEIEIGDPFLNSSIQGAPSYGQNTFEVDIPMSQPNLSPEALLVSWLDSNSKPEALSAVDVSLAWSVLSKSPYFQNTEKDGVLADVKSFAKRKLSEDSTLALESYPLSFANNELWFNDLVSLGFIFSPAVAEASKFNQLLSKPFLSLLFSAGAQDRESFEETFSQAKRNWGLLSATTANDQSSEVPYEALATIKLKAKQLSFAMNSSIVHPFVLEAGKLAFESYIRDNNLPPGRHFDPGSLATMFKVVLERNMTIFNALSNRFPNAKIMNELAYMFQTIDSSLPSSYQELTSARPILNKDIVEGKAGFEPRPPLEGTKGYLVNLPALSIRFAMLARLSARGYQVATDILQKRDSMLTGISLIRLYQSLCSILPELCERDLVLAELFLQAESIEK